jgi:hypothetical protein
MAAEATEILTTEATEDTEEGTEVYLTSGLSASLFLK